MFDNEQTLTFLLTSSSHNYGSIKMLARYGWPFVCGCFQGEHVTRSAEQDEHDPFPKRARVSCYQHPAFRSDEQENGPEYIRLVDIYFNVKFLHFSQLSSQMTAALIDCQCNQSQRATTWYPSWWTQETLIQLNIISFLMGNMSKSSAPSFNLTEKWFKLNWVAYKRAVAVWS